MAGLRLPQELLDIIVDELSQDHDSLRALHSTARSFRQRVQSHFFRSVHLPEKHSCHSFLELCMASPNIPDLVQTLEIIVFINCDVHQALSFPNLRSLRIDGVPCINHKHPSRIAIHEIPSSLLTYPITTLTLHGLNIKSARMRHLLCSFPALRTLVMVQVRVCAPGPLESIYEAEETEHDDGPVIGDLFISFTSYNLCDMKVLLEINGRPFVLRGLRKLSCTWAQYWHGTRDLQLFLRATRRTLRELHLCHRNASYWGTYQMSHILDFSHVPCVIFEAPRRSTDQIIGLNWFTECLGYQEHGPARISQLHLSLRIPDFDTLSDHYRLVWRSLDRALAVERFASLEKFNILVIFDSPMAVTGEHNEDQLGLPQMEQAILSAFPALHEQRRISVQFVGP
ncbi:hypothetical protein F5146DRAFT_1044902 [Armillaria mellea]|nr:hypothetical protein F5146DRAFT_1044902 [Armillaria mellea]